MVPVHQPLRRCHWYPCFIVLLVLPVLASARPELLVEADQGDLARNLKASLSLNGQHCKLTDNQRFLLERRLLRDAHQAARAVGFYQPAITVDIDPHKDCWRARLSARAGTATLVIERDIRLDGEAADDPAMQQLLRDTPLQVGSRVDHQHYQRLRDELNRLALSRGYFDAEMSRHELRVRPARNEASIHLHLDSGKRYHFGDIELDQQVLNDNLARRYLRFAPGDPWDGARLLESQQALLGSGYFTTVQLQRLDNDAVHADPPRADAILQLSAQPRHAWLVGAGASTDTGPRLRLGIEDRYVNARGHRWQADANLSLLRQTVSSRYEIPLKDPLRDRLAFSSRYQREDGDSAKRENLGIGASLIGELGKGWVLTRSLELERERFTIAEQSAVSELLIPGVQLQKIRRDDLINPRRGWKLGSAVRGTHQSLSSSDTFVQWRAWSKLIQPLARGRLLLRLDGGHLLVDDFSSVPASFRFFAGGDSSLRGFDYQTLGPTDANGEVIGGDTLLVGSIELDHPLTRRWHVAAFVDAGNAFDTLADTRLRRSAGAGLRWRSPLGPIRLDLARPIDAGLDWRIHLSMGPDL